MSIRFIIHGTTCTCQQYKEDENFGKIDKMFLLEPEKCIVCGKLRFKISIVEYDELNGHWTARPGITWTLPIRKFQIHTNLLLADDMGFK